MSSIKIRDSDSQQSLMGEAETPQICGICKREISKYTCPRCNLKYCSLNCYKHETHSECTEAFYKDNIIEEIKSQRVDEDDKKKMIDMLRRFEQEGDEMSREAMEMEDEDYDDITDRFNDLNIGKSCLIILLILSNYLFIHYYYHQPSLFPFTDSADIETIWSKLTPRERVEFQEKFIDGKPESLLEIIDELPLWKPWWEYNNNNSSKIVEISSQSVEDEEYSQKKSRDTLLQRPQILSDIKKIEELTKKSPNPALTLNLINILYPNIYETNSINVLWDLSPILNTTKNLVFQSVDEAITASSIITIQNPKYKQLPEFQSLILGDIVCLLTSIDTVLAALSDLYRLFQSQQQTSTTTTSNNYLPKNPSKTKDDYKKKVFLTEKKLYFYIAYVNSLSQQSTAVLEILRHEVEAERLKCIREGQEYKRDREKIEEVFGNRQYGKDESEVESNDGKGGLITEI
ncbi:14678_t:CDS:2 [Gigaspora margarita]|uniref:14678_t:CDS:1 n=1 Tax=Gigaspora margarita TaxID=4874 RepID=A0ABN7VXF2_GIGMA|nr:14678_t:CDS:2 [Gigaspora margarita]